MAEYLDWSDELAMQIIADVHGNNFMNARKIIAGRLRVIQETETQAVFARMRLMAARTTDEQREYAADVEENGIDGWDPR